MFLSFEKFLEDGIERDNFSKEPYIKNFKERQNISRFVLDSDPGCKYLDGGESFAQRYDEYEGVRYVSCLSMTYDAVFSLYEADSRTSYIFRFTDLRKEVLEGLDKTIKKMKTRNFEARLIGFQTNQAVFLYQINSFIRKNNMRLVELDLFGTDTRHVAIDLKTGTSFDVLINNRLYKPGELQNTATAEQFERSSMQAPKPPVQKVKE